MALWTDLVDPATLTGYARASLAEYEARKGTLARWLPNKEVADIAVRFIAGSTGLVDVAKWRAYDAEPEIGRRPTGKRVTIELPAVSQNIPSSEYEQLRLRGGDISDTEALNAILSTTDAVVRAIADAVEMLRGIVLQTGKATINQGNFLIDDDFGRAAGHTVTAPALWSVGSTDALTQLTGYQDTFTDANGEPPGAILGSTRALRAFAALDQMKLALVGGGTRPATVADVTAVVNGAGLPPFYTYDRRVSVNGTPTKVLSDDRVFLLPAPVDPNAGDDSDLGATFWGRTLTSTDPNYGVESSEQPGLVVGTYRNPKPPMGTEVIGDAIALPVLANANLSFVIDVL